MPEQIQHEPGSAREILEQARPWLREEFHRQGLLASWSNLETLAMWMERSAKLLDYWQAHPFARLRDLASAACSDAWEFGRLMSALLSDERVQAFMADTGDSAYHRDTIQPILESGAFDAVAQGRFMYPYTVGIYPAVSCMLSCKFCGRVPGVEYGWHQVEQGNELLSQLFAEAPRDSAHRFYISGGLEPLTNPGLDKLVSFAASRGFRMQLYTNGMMLTRKFLEAHEGLWDLETIRISLYGADDVASERTTSRAGVASRVIANAKELVRLRREQRRSTRLAFNYVVQRGQVTHLSAIGRAVANIIEEVGDPRAIAFLSLREDYAARGGTAICGEERAQLRDELFALRDFFAGHGMEELHLDFGYAMEGLMEGIEKSPVHRVTHEQMLGRGYPQISVVVDLLGDVYLFREAAFPGRAGAAKYVIGRLGRDGNFEEILRRHLLAGGEAVRPVPGDELFLDAFDHAVTAYLSQVNDDVAFAGEMAASRRGRGSILRAPVLPLRKIPGKYVPPLAAS